MNSLALVALTTWNFTGIVVPRVKTRAFLGVRGGWNPWKVPAPTRGSGPMSTATKSELKPVVPPRITTGSPGAGTDGVTARAKARVGVKESGSIAVLVRLAMSVRAAASTGAAVDWKTYMSRKIFTQSF